MQIPRPVRVFRLRKRSFRSFPPVGSDGGAPSVPAASVRLFSPPFRAPCPSVRLSAAGVRRRTCLPVPLPSGGRSLREQAPSRVRPGGGRPRRRSPRARWMPRREPSSSGRACRSVRRGRSRVVRHGADIGFGAVLRRRSPARNHLPETPQPVPPPVGVEQYEKWPGSPMPAIRTA